MVDLKECGGKTMTRPKSIILKSFNGCTSGNTMIIKLTDYQGNYIGMFHIRDPNIQAQFRADNINKIALIREKHFITANNLTSKP